MKIAHVLAILVVAVFGSSAVAAEEISDYDVIQYKVKEFFSGIREGGAKRAGRVANLEHGHTIWAQTKDGIQAVVSVPFGKMLEGLQPYKGYGSPHKISNIKIIGGELAVANIVANAPQENRDGVILEYFALAKVNGDWEIISLQWISKPGRRVDSD
jgi:hypothetical protein